MANRNTMHARIKGKVELDGAVATFLGKKREEVRDITSLFLDEVARSLLNMEEVYLHQLGVLHLYFYEVKKARTITLQTNTARRQQRTFLVKRKSNILIRKSRHFLKCMKAKFGSGIEEIPMEKYAVDEGSNQEQLEKKASHGCPNCGGKVDVHGSVLVCPKCGSEPFETERKSK